MEDNVQSTLYPNELNAKGYSSLSEAVQTRAWSLAYNLLSSGANPNFKGEHAKGAFDLLIDRIFRPPEYESPEDIYEGKCLAVKMISHGAEICWADVRFQAIMPSLCRAAANCGNAEVLTKLAKPFWNCLAETPQSIQINSCIEEDGHHKIRAGFKDALEIGFRRERPDIIIPCQFVRPADPTWCLFAAVDAGKIALVKLFLELGGDPWMKFEIKEPFVDLFGKHHSGPCRASQIARFRLCSTNNPHLRHCYSWIFVHLQGAEKSRESPITKLFHF